MAYESDIQSDVVAYARSYGIIAKKLSFGEGWPDFLFVFSGRVLFVEFKAPGETTSPLQEEIIRLLREQGATVHIVDDVSLGKRVLHSYFGL
jgi:hypothetical protein